MRKKNIFKIFISFLIILTTLFQTNLTVFAASSATLTGNDSDSSVNLSWSTDYSASKYYILQRNENGKSWYNVNDSGSISVKPDSKDFTTAGTHYYTVPVTGYYNIYTAGSQGASYGNNTGGKGAAFTSKVFLLKGDVLTINVGKPGTNGGGSGAAAGGGYTSVILNNSSYIQVAGGGGAGGTATGGGAATTTLNRGTTPNLTAGTNSTSSQGGGGGGAPGGAGGAYVNDVATITYYCSPWGNAYSGHNSVLYVKSDKTITFNDPLVGQVTLVAGRTHTWNYWHSFQQARVVINGVSIAQQTKYIASWCWNSDAAYGGTEQIGTPVAKASTGGSSFLNNSINGKTIANTTVSNTYTALTGKVTISCDSIVEANIATSATSNFKDIDAPNDVTSYDITTNNDGSLMTWNVPSDNKTTNNYQILVYGWGAGASDSLVATSNTLTYEYASGLKGYYYYVDYKATGTVNSSHTFTNKNNYFINFADTRYIHIAPVDNAGNIGRTTTFQIPGMYTSNEAFVETPDLAAPDKPYDGEVLSFSGTTVVLGWGIPEDNGTDYWHRLESWNADTYKRLLISDELKVNITTGLKGYYYYVDSSPNGVVTKSCTYVNTNRTNTIDLLSYGFETSYLHVAAVDYAGNISETYTFPCNLLDAITIPVRTDKIKISSDLNNYYLQNAQTNTYFVRASQTNESKFNLSFNSIAEHSSRNESYQKLYEYLANKRQPNDALYEISNNGNKQIIHEYLCDQVTGPKQWVMLNGNSDGNVKIDNGIINVSNVTLLRNAQFYNLNNLTTMYVNASHDNEVITIKPEARIQYKFEEENNTISSRDSFIDEVGFEVDGNKLDENNKINLIVDATSPEIVLSDVYEEDSENYNPLITNPTIITLEYADYINNYNPENPEYGSGVESNNGNVKVSIIQEQTNDGGAPITKVYTEETANSFVTIIKDNDKTGKILLNIDPTYYEEMSGFITIKVELSDNVGNVTVKEFRVLIMRLDASIKNISVSQYNGTNSFIAGENGVVEIETDGFIDQVSIVFPSALQELAEQEATLNGDYNEDEQSSQLSVDLGRMFNETYPRDNNGNITRVAPNLQTKLWGSANKGGMQWNGLDYEHCYLKHFFYAPIYSQPNAYDVYVIAYKQDPKHPNKIYQVSKKLVMNIGLVNGDVIEDITHGVKDRINDN